MAQQFEIEDYDDGELENGVSPQQPVRTTRQQQPLQSQEMSPGDDGVEQAPSGPQPDYPQYDAPAGPPPKVGRLRVFGQLYWYYKWQAIPLTLLAIFLLLLAIPQSRYPIVGLVLRRHFDVQLIDAKTGIPISGATVSLGDKTTETDAQGKARLSVRVGGKPISIDKKYYQTASEQVFVGINVQPRPQEFTLTATGRQVPITVLDKVSNKPVADSTIKVLDTNAKTDKNGKAFIVLPTARNDQQARLSADGYNQAAFPIQVTDRVVAANTLRLTPSGRALFLSNANGTIDVVGANFDGTGRKTVTQGTGNEDGGTQLFVSPNLKQAALFARRDATDTPKLHIIDTATGNAKLMDNTLAVFNPIGWAGDRFVYVSERKDLQNWQAGRVELKSYSPTESNVTILDKSAGEGSDAGNYLAEKIESVTIVDGSVLYAKTWWSGFQTDGLANRQNSISRVQPDGKGRQNLRTIQLAAGARLTNIAATIVKPQTIFLQSAAEGTTVYFSYQSGAVNQSNTITFNDVSKAYPRYYISPSGDTSYWSELRDGRTVFFLGDDNAGNAKQVADLQGYAAAGWHSNDYLLLTKDSQLYIMATNGLGKGENPVKISNYFNQP